MKVASSRVAPAPERSSFFGEFYFRTTVPFLSDESTRAEAAYLAQWIAELAPAGPVLDLGCGHGRHAALLSSWPGLDRAVYGIDLDAYALRRRAGGFFAVRGDFRHLPFREGSFGAAYAWYSSLFGLADEAITDALVGVRTLLRPGGLLIVESVPAGRFLAGPTAAFERQLPDGSRVMEVSRFHHESGRDHGRRWLARTHQETLCAEYSVRYYTPEGLADLLWATGYEVAFLHGGLDGAPASPKGRQLIAGGTKRD